MTKKRAVAVRITAIFLALAFMMSGLGAAEPGPADVVRSFNLAITKRNLDGTLALFASGSVQFTLKPAHSGVSVPTGVTTDLRAHWSTIAPVLFTMTASYKRVPDILDTRVEGDIATVWTQIATESVERNGSRRQEAFGEIYLLVRGPEGWKIGAIADNRGTDRLAVTQ